MKLLRVILVVLLSVSFILFPVVQATELALSSEDIIAPVIEHTPIEEDIYIGEQISITATVTDNVGLKNVILFYRNANASEFKRLKMNRDLDSFIYTAQLTATNSPGLEYYIQATDMAGNTLLFGYSFSPLEITVIPIPTIMTGNNLLFDYSFFPLTIDMIPTGDNSETNVTHTAVAAAVIKVDDEKKTSGISKWVWIGLGVVVAGAALSGGGGGGSTEPPPTTGGLTISGPAPP